MNIEKMTIHKALAELKIIGDRINTAILGTTFVTANRHSNSKIQGIGIAEFCNDNSNNYVSVTDLIRRRDALKRAVVLSNAITKVTIGNKEYSVAEAIEMKKSGIEYKKTLMNTMRKQYEQAKNTCARENDILPGKADTYVAGLYGTKDASKLTDDMQRSRSEYLMQNTFELIETVKVLDEIKKLEAEISAYTTEVDAALSVSNALTTVEFSY